MPKTDTDQRHHDFERVEKDRNHSRGANELALGYLNPASMPEPTYPDEVAMLEARGGSVDDDETGAKADAQANPNEDWLRDDLNKLAGRLGVDDPEALPNKAAVVDAIKAAQGGAK